MRKRCPVYGFHCPDRQPTLIHVGGNECGLDIDNNGPCKMETDGREVNFWPCEVAAKEQPFLKAGAARIGFFATDESEDWPG
jgi:hypothetical protein